MWALLLRLSYYIDDWGSRAPDRRAAGPLYLCVFLIISMTDSARLLDSRSTIFGRLTDRQTFIWPKILRSFDTYTIIIINLTLRSLTKHKDHWIRPFGAMSFGRHEPTSWSLTDEVLYSIDVHSVYFSRCRFWNRSQKKEPVKIDQQFNLSMTDWGIYFFRLLIQD